MTNLLVVGIRAKDSVNTFAAESFLEARNLRDYLEETGDYKTVAIYLWDGARDLPVVGAELEMSRLEDTASN
jgi:hypothetical protein